MFIAPRTAAVVSTSVQQNTDGMLNLFITDRAALDALTAEYEHYFSLCRPLMRFFTMRESDAIQQASESLLEADGDAYFCSAMPPLFAMPEEAVRELSAQAENEALFGQWERSLNAFRKIIKKQRLTLVLQDPDNALLTPDSLRPMSGRIFSPCALPYTREQYLTHMERLRQMEKQYHNLEVRFSDKLADNTLLYVKEDAGVIMAKSGAPQTAFLIGEKNMVSAFWNYIGKCVLSM